MRGCAVQRRPVKRSRSFWSALAERSALPLSRRARAAECYEVTRTRTETVELTRSHWGYVKLTVESDAPFLIPLRTCVTEEDFIGSSCLFSYEIREEALHAGRNYGRLFFHMPDGTFSLEVCAARTEKRRRADAECARVDLRGYACSWQGFISSTV